ncbi:MBOAT family O-acyltransferase [Flavobacterium columnare]|uniref:MBOAT family O-acyltransferase n=1 Tax=Flavobacterium columnare TaxID=996 RepID=UPI001BC8842A|nr:MBOAT family O-acyltransferase [Flavobacterium columnare]AUX19200.1 acyltransferase [Flavobacterium columnare]
MFFNSLEFAIFLPLVFLLYWFVFNRSKKAQNTLLIIASYYFYACWDWHFLFLLIFSTLLDYVSGIKIERSNNERIAQFWFWLSVGINLGFLGIFKYYNFFAQSFADLCNKIGFEVHPYLLQLVLPVGISFYTFHGLSYVIDIYKKRIKAEYNFIDYSLFVSYFPLLVAGPIERATHLLPQVKVKREFNFEKAKEGTYQIIWGLVKKIVVADFLVHCMQMLIFDHSHTMNSYSLVLGAIYFAFQIYGDFSGYSDIALGTSKLFGIDLLKNFNYPYFSRDIAEFWRRWHISLSSWFRDYLYIPLGGSQGGKWMQVRNTFIIFLVSGFWHGANWTFIIWGLINAIYFLPLLLFNKNRTNLGTIHFQWNASGITTIFNIISTFALSTLAWIFFRAKSITDAYNYIRSIFTRQLLSLPEVRPKNMIVLIFVFMTIEWIGRKNDYALATFGFNWSKAFRWSFYMVLLIAIFILGTKEQKFIYFQF